MPESKRILLVEDDALDVELAMLAFAAHGFAQDVSVVRDGQEALDYLYREGEHAGRAGPDPELVLMDLKMPRLDGRQVLARLRGDPGMLHLRVVVLSTSNAESDRSECVRLGADAYEVKPGHFDGLMSLVASLTSGAQPAC